MEYSKLVEVYEELGETQSTLQKTDILAEFFAENEEDLDKIILLSMGRSFPEWKDLDLGISSKTMVDIIKQSTGRSEEEIEKVWKEKGDLGFAAEQMAKQKTQQNLMSKDLTVERVLEILEKVAKMEQKSLGSVSMDKKKKEVASLLSDADPLEARYIARTFISNLRLGVAEGLIRDALSEAFFDGENKKDIQHAYNLTNDFREVGKACTEGIEDVRALEIEMFRPIKSMLAKKVDSIEEGFEEVGRPAAVDYKYDGVRAQIHVKDGEVKLFTRRLEEITDQFPDAVEAVKENIEAETAIIDSEILAYDPETKETIPFQQLSKRIKRKYDIEKLKQEIPVEIRPFDIMYLNGSSELKTGYKDRYSKLENIVDESEWSIRMVDHIETEDAEEVRDMDQKSLNQGHEGIMMKSLDAEYKPGNRVGYMVKLKPVMETLDLAVIGAKWGEGRRSGWLSRIKLGCYNQETDEYEMIGRMATGLTDEELEEITGKLKPLITSENGRDVNVKPEIILEAEYEEIQKSPNYISGYALRFPRMKAFRDDKEEADTLKRVRELFESQ